MRSMKIAYCIKSLHVAGGMERVITAKANYLVEQGHEVAIITTDTMGRKPFFPSTHLFSRLIWG